MTSSNSESSRKDLRTLPLIELAEAYLRDYGTITADFSLYQGPKKHSMSFLILIKDLIIGVWVLDWKRSVGTDKIIHIERIIQRSNLSGGFIVANNFSPNARELARTTNTLELIERAEIIFQG